MIAPRSVRAPLAQAPQRLPAAPRPLRAPLRAKDPESQAQSALDGGLINPAFAAALSAAMQRSGGEKAAMEDASRSVEEERASPLKPVEEMLVHAIHNSRASLRRLVERQAVIEAEIAAEQKQAARLEWLLSRVRSDYAFFSTLDKMNQESE